MYKLIGKIYNGANLQGFEVENIDTSERSNISYNKAVKLIKNKDVQGFKIETIDNIDYIIGVESIQISSLPNKCAQGSLVFDSRVIEGGKVIAYKIKASDLDKEITLSKTKVWELAYYGLIRGLKAYLKRDESGNIRKILIAD